jgi:hypothetical protein
MKTYTDEQSENLLTDLHLLVEELNQAVNNDNTAMKMQIKNGGAHRWDLLDAKLDYVLKIDGE